MAGRYPAQLSQNSQDAVPLAAPANAPLAFTGRKRKTLDPSLPIMIRRSSRLCTEQLEPAPGSGRGAQPEFDTQPDQVTGQPPPPSPLPVAASQRPYRIQLSRAKRNLHGAGPRFVDFYYFSAVYWRALSCHRVPRTRSSFLRLIIECPLRTGKQFPQLSIGISPQPNFQTGT